MPKLDERRAVTIVAMNCIQRNVGNSTLLTALGGGDNTMV